MKLYYATGACSLADRISLAEAGIPSEFDRIDLKTKLTSSDTRYVDINPKGYVPALLLDSGELVTENVAILAWIADQAPHLAPAGPLGRIRLLEALAYIATEVHKAFKPFFHASDDTAKAEARDEISNRLALIARGMTPSSYMLGPHFTVADAYLFVILTWAKKFDVALPEPLLAYFQRMLTRKAVDDALVQEGLPHALPERLVQRAMP